MCVIEVTVMICGDVCGALLSCFMQCLKTNVGWKTGQKLSLGLHFFHIPSIVFEDFIKPTVQCPAGRFWSGLWEDKPNVHVLDQGSPTGELGSKCDLQKLWSIKIMTIYSKI